MIMTLNNTLCEVISIIKVCCVHEYMEEGHLAESLNV